MLSSPSCLLLGVVLAAAVASVSAHGYLSSPPPRGIEKESYLVDDLKSPNKRGLCRGEPVGKLHPVKPGGTVTLGFTITAPHVGPCRVTLLDANLRNERPLAEKYNCAASRDAAPWVVNLPANARGHMVLRWYWEGRHVSPAEPYEQCIDLDFGTGGGASTPNYDDRSDNGERQRGGKHESRNRRRDSQTKLAANVDGDDDNGEEFSDSRDSNDDNNNENDNDDVASSQDNADLIARDSTLQSTEDACAPGSYKCNSDSTFSLCSNGDWVRMSCPLSTTCRPTSPTAIVCDHAASVDVVANTTGGSELRQASPQEDDAATPEDA